MLFFFFFFNCAFNRIKTQSLEYGQNMYTDSTVVKLARGTQPTNKSDGGEKMARRRYGTVVVAADTRCYWVSAMGGQGGEREGRGGVGGGKEAGRPADGQRAPTPTARSAPGTQKTVSGGRARWAGEARQGTRSGGRRQQGGCRRPRRRARVTPEAQQTENSGRARGRAVRGTVRKGRGASAGARSCWKVAGGRRQVEAAVES